MQNEAEASTSESVSLIEARTAEQVAAVALAGCHQ